MALIAGSLVAPSALQPAPAVAGRRQRVMSSVQASDGAASGCAAAGGAGKSQLRVLHAATADQQSHGELAGVSTVEVFGFVGWITSSVVYVLYLLWAYTPPSMLEAHGVHYYPSQYWAVALPAWACVTVVASYWLYESLCMMAAPPAKGAGTLQDWATRDKADAGMPSYFSAPGGERGIPPLADIPAELVSLVLHAGLAPREAEEVYDRRMRQRRGQWSGPVPVG